MAIINLELKVSVKKLINFYENLNNSAMDIKMKEPVLQESCVSSEFLALKRTKRTKFSEKTKLNQQPPNLSRIQESISPTTKQFKQTVQTTSSQKAHHPPKILELGFLKLSRSKRVKKITQSMPNLQMHS